MSESASKPTRSSVWRNNGLFGTQARANVARQDTRREGKPTFQHQTDASKSESELTSRANTRHFGRKESFGCKLSIAQHQADDSARRGRAGDVNGGSQSSATAANRQQSGFRNHSLSPFAASSKYASDEREEQKQEQSRHESICDKFLSMARRRYFISLFCLSAFVGACLLASVAISRSISTADLDSDTTREGRQQASLLGEQFEVRSFELVDLIEHDRTFAYTKWQIKVRVPKSAPNYQQHSLAPNAIEPADGVAERSEAAGAAKAELSVAGSEREEAPVDGQEDQFQLVGTRAFVADHMEALASARNSAEVGKVSQAAGSELEAALAGELEDPIHVAAAELQIDSKSVNSTLSDCFMVDLDKRYGQKVALETRHRQLANTRRVSFRRMLEAITACRLLTWATLAGQTNSTASSAQQAPPTRGAFEKNSTFLGAQPKLLTKREQAQDERQSRPAPTNSKHVVNELIKPVERKPEQRGVSAQEPFGAIISAIINWSRLPNATVNSMPSNEKRALGGAVPLKSLEVDEAQQTPSTTTRAENSSAADEEAKRASYLNAGMSMISGIVPNTLWCGLGDRALNYSQLGSEFMVDACCRAHDHCPIRLKPFTADYGLINWSMSTRSHCDCDLDFNDCLTSINSTLSNVIKTLYFRFIGLQCIDLGTAAVQRPPPPVDEAEVRV